jgi:anti-sigma B factor antagonist
MGARRSAPGKPFEAHLAAQGQTAFIRLAGEFDLACAQDFRERSKAIDNDAFRRVVLDLRKLTFIDSTGLRLIIDLWKRSREKGLEIVVVRGSEAVQRVFKITGMDEVLPMVDARSRLADPS